MPSFRENLATGWKAIKEKVSEKWQDFKVNLNREPVKYGLMIALATLAVLAVTAAVVTAVVFSGGAAAVPIAGTALGATAAVGGSLATTAVAAGVGVGVISAAAATAVIGSKIHKDKHANAIAQARARMNGVNEPVPKGNNNLQSTSVSLQTLNGGDPKASGPTRAASAAPEERQRVNPGKETSAPAVQQEEVRSEKNTPHL